MSMPAPKPATTPIPVQLSADEFDTFIQIPSDLVVKCQGIDIVNVIFSPS
jgi:hypothetical protein